MIKNKTLVFRYLALLLAAVIWGSAFVAQSVGMDYMGPFTFSAIRNVIGSIVLIPVILIIDKNRRRKGEPLYAEDGSVLTPSEYYKNTVKGGVICGIILCLASNLQQIALISVPAGKAGFITALYVILVPVCGLFLHKKVSALTWVAVILSVIGLYLLSIKPGAFTISTAEVLLFLCAFGFTAHILTVDHIVVRANPVMMSSIQFAVCGIISLILMFIFENPTLDGIMGAIVPILYAGVLSSGGAYTLQIVGQRGTNPTLSCLILSLESVFSVLAGFFILHENMSARELIGCVIMFVAIIISQVFQSTE